MFVGPVCLWRKAESSAHFLIVVVFWSFGLSCLYILEIKPLLIASFADIFSHSTEYLFILFLVSFAVQKLIQKSKRR